MLSKASLSSLVLLLSATLTRSMPLELDSLDALEHELDVRTTLPSIDCSGKRTGIHFTDNSACQIPVIGQDPMAHCPQSGILVDPSMTHISADYPTYPTIQKAIDSIQSDRRKYTIVVMAGTYNETLNITRVAPLTILGQTYDPLDQKKNLVKVIGGTANYAGRYTDNAFSASLTVAPNLNASLTGAGPTGFNVSADTPFGNTDFRVYNIDFSNQEFEQANGPALAISISRANAGLYFCGFYSYQDTVYIGKLGNAYFYKNEIAGQTDFLYGFGTAYISNSKLLMRSCGGGVTAWKGTNTTFANKYGVYISSSDLVASNATIAAKMVGKCALGRPWNALHRSVFMDCYMDASIKPQGYIPWSSQPVPETLMGEYGTYGQGWNPSGRMLTQLSNGVPLVMTTELDDNTVKPYRKPEDVFITPDGKSNIGWIDTQFYAW
ncbi:hypothetical protein H072_3795 [Dactylellina haptotyla CBS 200.50]|uniref:pectinesterase n=1 Tax=Dactylellina haptotyla (strain CBS 200.50) TaxID=1284197 RepID=S8AGQ1_DACHA|nr:hypothetical protein H072_3795 [Dactylellina haptotyla CBS 200.50]